MGFNNDEQINKIAKGLLTGDQRYMQDGADALLAMRLERNALNDANIALNAANMKLLSRVKKLEKGDGKKAEANGEQSTESDSG